jgi:hypothetical protein
MQEGKENVVAFLNSHGADHSTLSHGCRSESKEKVREHSNKVAQLQQLGVQRCNGIDFSLKL